ncbi:MAG TPA: tetratricopeptide repeat protein [Candidatus Obscuribacterales bacterium]
MYRTEKAAPRLCLALASAHLAVIVGSSLPGAGQESTFDQSTRAGFAAYRDGNDAQAEAWLRTALKEAESFPKEDSRLPKALHNLAMVLSSEGKLSEAEELIRRALAIREQVSGRESEDVAVSLNNLAILLYEQHRYAEAEEALRRVLSIDARILPDDHKERRLSLDNYAKVLRKLNKYQEANRVESTGTAYRPPPKDGLNVGAAER